MKHLSFFRVFLGLGLAVCAQTTRLGMPSALAAEPLKVQARLVWATDESQSPNPNHKLLPPDDPLVMRLKSTYRWTNYFEVMRTNVSIAANSTNTVHISEKCKLELGNLGNNWVEVKLFGQGKKVSDNKQKVAPDWPVIFAGNSSNSNAWFVAITKIDPNAKSKPAPVSTPK